ncbi:6-carboxytetrahydropterin synthase QueD [Tepidiphilus sp. J10]|uniref:6-carboxytetrahydropterin synthase QueD n=1 Tax=Tepidiphilus sp. J10 TaxID=2502185 RepID=UPI00115EA9EF|nr:6-carboxytetrahydropterin synthase QueD [Tepidiphilus sp. J10]
MLITRRFEFDAGHRIPNHESHCRHLHGHRYVLEVTLRGEPVTQAGRSDEGMVLDFSAVKTLVQRALIEQWDHAFLAYRGDQLLLDALERIPDHKTVLLDAVPTAENLARIAYETLEPRFAALYGERLCLARVRLYETPNCWADYPAG